MSDKTQIAVGGRLVGMPVTESQAVLILRWLDSDGVMEALSDLRPAPDDAPECSEADERRAAVLGFLRQFPNNSAKVDERMMEWEKERALSLSKGEKT